MKTPQSNTSIKKSSKNNNLPSYLLYNYWGRYQHVIMGTRSKRQLVLSFLAVLLSVTVAFSPTSVRGFPSCIHHHGSTSSNTALKSTPFSVGGPSSELLTRFSDQVTQELSASQFYLSASSKFLCCYCIICNLSANHISYLISTYLISSFSKFGSTEEIGKDKQSTCWQNRLRNVVMHYN